MQKVVDAANEASTLRRIRMAHLERIAPLFQDIVAANLVDKFHDDELEDITERRDLVHTALQVVERTALVHMYEHHERVAFAGGVLLSFQELGDQLRCIRNEKLEVA